MTYEFDEPFVLDTTKYESTFGATGTPLTAAVTETVIVVPGAGERDSDGSRTPLGGLSPKVAWSNRVRRVGGFIQLAFAGLWLVRGSLNVHGPAGIALAGIFTAMILVVLAYGIRVTAGTGPRPPGKEAKRIERSVTVATIIELVAAFVLPVIVIAAGHSDWVLPSIAITIGPLFCGSTTWSTSPGIARWAGR